MARIKEYVIDLAPLSWQTVGKRDKSFFDKQVLNKTVIGLHIEQQHEGDTPFINPIHVDLTFYMPIPNSLCSRKKTVWHRTIPDLSDLQRFIFDAINKIGSIWRDDSIISSVLVQKVYDQHPRTHLVITELE